MARRLKFVTIGIALLITGSLGAVLVSRAGGPSPASSVEQVPPALLPTVEPELPRSGDTSPPSPVEWTAGPGIQTRTIDIKPGLQAGIAEIPPPAIRIVSPGPVEYFVPPQSVRFEFEVYPAERKIDKVEIFAAEGTRGMYSIYNNLKDVQLGDARLIKIGEIRRKPWILEDGLLTRWLHDGVLGEGSFLIYGLVTDNYGIRQISDPVPILIGKAPLGAEKDRGWPSPRYAQQRFWSMPDRPESYLRPEPKGCEDSSSITREILDNTGKKLQDPIEGQRIRLELMSYHDESSFPDGWRIDWKLNNGRIISGNGTKSVVLDTTGLGGQTIIAFANARQNGCATSNFIHIEISGKKPFQFGENESVLNLQKMNKLTAYLKDNPTDKVQFITYGGVPFCGGEAYEAGLIYSRFVLDKGIDPDRIIVTDGGYEDEIRVTIAIVPEGADLIQPDPSIDQPSGKMARCSQTRLLNLSGIEGSETIKTRYLKCPEIGEKLSFFYHITDLDEPPFIPTRFRMINVCPYNGKDPQDQSAGLKFKLSPSLKGIFGNQPVYKYYSNGGVIEDAGDNLVWDLSGVRSIPGHYTIFAEVSDGCSVRSVVAATIHLTNFCTPCASAQVHSNHDDIQGDISFKIHASQEREDRFMEAPKFEWHISSGRINNFFKGTSRLDVTLPAEDGIQKNELEVTVDISNLRTFQGKFWVETDLPFYKGDLRYDWQARDSKGKVLISKENARSVEIDMKNISLEDDKLSLYYKVSGYNIKKFEFEIPDWARENETDDNGVKIDLSLSGGKIIERKKNTIWVSTFELPYNEKITGVATVAGLRQYCYPSIETETRVGIKDLYADSVDGYGNEKLANYARRMAVRDGLPVSVPASVIDGGSAVSAFQVPGPDLGSSSETGPTVPAEREFVSIDWPQSPVIVQRAFSIIVSYNRTKDSIELSDQEGNVISELKTAGISRLIKDKWGPDYVVWAAVRLKSASLYHSDSETCSPGCTDEFLPLTPNERKWVFSVKAHEPGEHLFSIELWIEGRHKDNIFVTAPEMVWRRDDLKVNAYKYLFWSSYIISGGFIIMAILGLLLLIRGIHIQIAGGDIVGQDKIGGNKVGGDMIVHDKIPD